MNTTIVIVSYKQTELIKAAHESIRKFYPTIPVIIIDGSPADSDCWNYLHKLSDPNTQIHTLEYNIGHGRGLHMGIGMAKTEYVLLMDSDVTIDHEGGIEYMLDWIGSYYGVGELIYVDENGHNTGNQITGIQYLHPHFALISKSKYSEYPPFFHHGAPCLNAMKGGPNISPISIKPYITHHERGTRAINPTEFHPSNWDKV